MSKRSNDFQRLLTAIYTAMASLEGSKVTECASLLEPDGTPREIDILIEATVCEHPLRMAVECRDRSRKSDVQWINELLGKYRNLKVDKVIAVSRTGFSQAAKTKAQAGGIETRLLQQCVEADFSSEFFKLGIGQFIVSPRLQSLAFELVPPAHYDLTLQPTVDNREGRRLGSRQGILLDCYNKSVLPRIKEFIDTDFLPSCRVLEDLNKQLGLTCPVDVANVFVHATDGSAYEITKVTYLVAMEAGVIPSDVNYY